MCIYHINDSVDKKTNHVIIVLYIEVDSVDKKTNHVIIVIGYI